MLFATVVSMFPDAYACMKRIGEVLETEPVITDSPKETCGRTCRGTVEFRNVTFAYPGADAPVIKSVSCLPDAAQLFFTRKINYTESRCRYGACFNHGGRPPV